MAQEQVAIEVAEETTQDSPAAQEPVGHDHAATTPGQKQAVVKKTAVAKRSVKKPLAKKSPSTKTAATKKRRVKKKKPVAKKKAAKRIGVKKRVVPKRVAKKTVPKKPTSKRPAAMKTSRKKSTAKKSAPKKRKTKKQSSSNGTTKAQSIRDTAKELGKKARPRDIIAALAEMGISVSSPQVTTVLKAAGLRRGRRRRKVVAAVAAKQHSGNGRGLDIHELVQVKKLAEQLGGTAKLKELAAALERLG